MQGIYEITENTPVVPAVYRLTLRGDVSAVTAPGQFINIALSGRYLRRPISVYDLNGDTLSVIYKTVGAGTEQLSRMRPGERLDVLCGLGNGYVLSPAGERPLLIGGGVGVPPLYLLARRLREDGKRTRVILGFNREEEVFGEAEFAALGCEVTVTTADGSRGVKGFVTEAMTPGYTYIYACGPEPMLKAVYKRSVTSGQFSFERRMGCGFGACMGCSCKTVTGFKRICREGPVLCKEEILWEE